MFSKNKQMKKNISHNCLEYKALLDAHGEDSQRIQMLERFAFYERAKKAYAVVATGETAIYANILLKKGVVQ